MIRPLRVTLSGGTTWSYEPRGADDAQPFLYHHAPATRTGPLRQSPFILDGYLVTDDDRALVQRMIAGETEEIPE